MFSHILVSVTDFDRALTFDTAVMQVPGNEARFRELEKPWAGWQMVPQLVPAPAEPNVRKRFNAAFEGAAPEEELQRSGITNLVLAGAATHGCIRATAYGALDRGDDVTLVEDAHTTGPIDLAAGRRTEAGDVVDELSIAMKWLSDAGCRNGAAGAGLAQAAPGPQPAALRTCRIHLHREPPVQTPRSPVWRHRAGERTMGFRRATA